jgi:GH35 family endo-1,4-beta-xylanase
LRAAKRSLKSSVFAVAGVARAGVAAFSTMRKEEKKQVNHIAKKNEMKMRQLTTQCTGQIQIMIVGNFTN